MPKICEKLAAIMKICKLLRKLRILLDFAINSAIAESENPGGTNYRLISIIVRFFPFFKQKH